ncbi:GNAT family N-acetyltransferase [Nostoc sp.]|uniref:GNAT family N-acetyltransferase n=1 Tax=Nostoc sp. TaxID=1180 RepID=UPI003FA52B62
MTLARSHQGKGYATEALTHLLEYLFTESNLLWSWYRGKNFGDCGAFSLSVL